MGLIFSGHVWSYALKEKSALAVAKALIKHWETIPKPFYLHSDNGGEFVNELINIISRLINVSLINGEAYDPRDQGKVERYNQTFQVMLGNSFINKI